MSIYDLQGLKDETGYEPLASETSFGCCNPSPVSSAWSIGCGHSYA
ncbi:MULTISPECIES: hypothetical protein [unclassified Streptomyces]